jgi:hypothetical protein
MKVVSLKDSFSEGDDKSSTPTERWEGSSDDLSPELFETQTSSPQSEDCALEKACQFKPETEGQPSVESSGSRRVKFSVVQIREYSQTLGDNPAVFYGAPIQLSWEYEEHGTMDIDQFEAHRGERRTPMEMVLSYMHRRNTLRKVYGFSEAELKSVEKETKKIKRQRATTNTMLIIMQVETALESAGRKARRLLSRCQQ